MEIEIWFIENNKYYLVDETTKMILSTFWQ